MYYKIEKEKKEKKGCGFSPHGGFPHGSSLQVPPTKVHLNIIMV